MGDEYTETVDTSSDMDTSEDFSENISADTNDIADDIPEDIPEDVPEDSSADSDDMVDDIPEDIPEDVPEDSSADSDDIADDVPEDIPEDVPEDSSADSDDIADDIPEDVPEDSSADSDDISDDIPEDIPEDVPEDSSSDSDDMADDIPEDIPEDVPEDSSSDSGDMADDIPEDIPEDVPEDSSSDSDNVADDIPEDVSADAQSDFANETSSDGTEDTTSNVSGNEQSDGTQNDMDDDSTSDETEDTTSDVSGNEQSDDTQNDMDDDSTLDETGDVASDVSGDEQPNDIQNDMNDESTSDETNAVASDVSGDEQPDDTQNDMDDDSTSDETGNVASDVSDDEQPDDTQNDMDDDSASDKTSDTDSDTSGDEQPDDTQDDVTDETPSDEPGDTDSDASADTKERCPTCGKPIDQCVCKDNEVDEGSIEQCPKCGKPIDQCICTNEVGDDTISSNNGSNDDIERNADTQEDAFRQLSDYMNEHNYGREDFAAYSQDPEWQRLHSKAYPDYIPPETSSADTQEDAFRQLSDYMNEHNYGREDFAVYSQDPKWQRLHSNAYPDYTPPEEISEDITTDTQRDITNETPLSEAEDIVSDASVDAQGDMTDGDSKSDIFQDTDTMSAEISEVAFNQELSKEFKENILSDPELTSEQKKLMLGSFDKVNRSDINDKTGEVQTGNLMSDMLKPAQVDNMDSVSEMQESSSFIHAMEISNSVIDRYEKVRNNTALLNDETGYQIAMNEMRKDLEKQVADIDLAIAENDTAKMIAEENLRNYSPEMEVSTLSDSKYRELVENLQNTRAQSNQLRSQRNYLESLQNEASTEISDEFKGISFISPVRKSFSDTFSELINEQGAAYPDEIVNDCGVCTMGNLANQHGGKYTERSGLSTGFGEYDYIQITEDMLPDEKIYALEHNGLTSLDSQAKILNKMGYEAMKYENGASFDEIVDNISKGNSMSLNLYGGDLNSGSDIAKRPGRIASALSGQQAILPANHAVTIAGLAVNPSGKPIGFFVNDTGGYGGNNNPSIFVSKAKYEQMMRKTVGISSIVCTGKKAFV